MTNSQPKLILYELNEVPKKILTEYAKRKPKSTLNKLIKEGLFFETKTEDNGELHPWTTWPTLHRGVTNELHNIRFINQNNINQSKYKPVWRLLAENNIEIGIFGSLQSYPPLKSKFTKFYLPDTFSPDSSSYPKYFECFQSFNLNITNENKGEMRSISYDNYFKFFKICFKGLVNLRSFFHTAKHYFLELFDKRHKRRRPIIQPILSFEIFFKELKKTKPSFTTYFTNHVAAMMHKYWKDSFPGDFGDANYKINDFNKENIFCALDVVDNQLNRLLKFSSKNNYDIWVMSSMGQESIIREEMPEIYLSDFSKFIRFLELKVNDFKILPAMQPDITIEFRSQKVLDSLLKKLAKLNYLDNQQIFNKVYKVEGNSLNLNISKSKTLIHQKIIYNNKIIKPEILGLKILKKTLGTAYHIPFGTWIAYGPHNKKIKNINRRIVDTRHICPTILGFFKISQPKYMKKSLIDIKSPVSNEFTN